MTEPLADPSFVGTVVEPMFQHKSIGVAFKNRLDLELKNTKSNSGYHGHRTYPPEIDSDPDFVGLKIMQGDHIRSATEEGGVSDAVYRTENVGVYLIVRSRIDEKGKSRVSKSLTFVGENKVREYEANPDDLKPLDK